MTEPFTKPVPVVVSINELLPAIALAGDRLIKTGTGLLTVVLLIVKLRKLLDPPPGEAVNTETLALPAVLISEAGTVADNFVALI